jgi:leukotriene-A4 hydrolase
MARLDPHSYADLAQGVHTHIDWVVQVDFDAQVLRCVATIKLDRAANGALDLDTRGLSIESVTDGAGNPLEFELGAPEGFMGAKLTVRRTLPTDTVVVTYTTAPDASALQWLEPALTAGDQPFLFSQCQPIHARSILPCQDSPKARVTYSATVTVPKALAVVMSAAPGERSVDDAAGTSTWRFDMPQAIPTYLLALAVGDLVAKEIGPRTMVWAEPATVEAAAWEFADAEKMLEAAEGLFGPYLWDRFDFLVMPPAFPYGGMENPRLTFLTPTLMAGDRSLVNVLAHELAHSWTGNLVTNATMNDFWLNEGFTVWAERRILEVLEGDDEVALSAAIGRHSLDGEIARFGADSPLTHLETDLAGTDPDEVYSVVPYEKGFLLVALLERTLGRPAFDAFVRRYIEHFGFQSITTADFEAYLDVELPGIREKVDADLWIHGPGVPDTAPSFSSPVLSELSTLAAGWAEGARPDVEAAKSWSASLWQIYLPRLPRTLPHDDLAWLDAQFGLTESGNSEILCAWLEIAAASGYPPATPRVREFLGRVGRMKYLKPLYKALLQGNPVLAREIFEASKAGYHPIARGGLEAMLAVEV